MEIERKFIISNIPSYLKLISIGEILQGYLAYGENGTEVRIRKIGNECYLTIKGPGDLMRNEVEFEIKSDQFKNLWPLTLGRQIAKTRYVTILKGEKIELDIYKKPFGGLIIAEIEFLSEVHSSNFTPPDWFGEEVTYNPIYKNKNMAANQSLPISPGNKAFFSPKLHKK